MGKKMRNSHKSFAEKSEYKRRLGTPEFGPKFQDNIKMDLKGRA
jgi:hypothetical protein